MSTICIINTIPNDILVFALSPQISVVLIHHQEKKSLYNRQRPLQKITSNQAVVMRPSETDASTNNLDTYYT